MDKYVYISYWLSYIADWANTTMKSRLAQDYPAVMREQLADRLPPFTEQEFKLLKDAEVGFYGMNYYTCQFARHRSLPAPDTDYVGNVDELQDRLARAYDASIL